jgi:potassium-transporting ATPase potassium-binding subunit
MTTNDWFQLALYFGLLVALTKPLGAYMARVYQGQPCGADRALGWLERLIYRLSAVDPQQEMSWRQYAVAVLLFNGLGIIAVYVILRLQDFLPLNPQKFAANNPDLAFDTAASFATNTNWQSYGGESTLSYFSQMIGLTVQNFVSAASGMAVLVALIRGLARRTSATIGNFWFDLVRSTLYIFMPMSVLLALVLVSQGVIQNFKAYDTVTLLQPTTVTDGKPVTEVTLPMGPAASQVAIKQLGTNGGGFFNVNSAHPFENPTPLANLLEELSILAIAAGLCYTFGAMVGDTRQGWAILAVMLLILVPLTIGVTVAEQKGVPAYDAMGIDQRASATEPGGNMEGKDTRFGIVNSAIWASATTAASNGSVNAMHDSFTPIGGMIPLWLIQLGEVIFGGVGSGLYGMLMFAIVAVFIAGLMVGRTPEYLGKKIEAYEMKMASLVILIPPLLVLVATAIAVAGPGLHFADPTSGEVKSPLNNPGAHGFSEMLYAFSSAGNNNGSAFAGLNANVPFYNVALGIVMLVARYWLMIPTLAIAGSLAQKKFTPPSAGTLPTHQPLFVVMLTGTVLLVGALTFVPALALGPVVEQLQMMAR